MQITLLVDCHGKTVSVWADFDDAEACAARYNADPFVAAETPDPDAPYHTEVWTVKNASEPHG